ncbi:MAG: hypothetical protein Q9160_000860 [Pyrenula sp. 1 TL-2023]
MMESGQATPSVPARRALRANLYSHRPSIPRTPNNRPSQPYVTRPYTPASPEVISSLISSLSAISSPAANHFESLPYIDSQNRHFSAKESDVSLSRVTTNDSAKARKRLPPHNGFGMDYGAYNDPDNVANGDVATQSSDAAIAPVIRMARPPAPKSSPRSREGSLRSLKLRRSQTSLNSSPDDKGLPKPSTLEPGSRSPSAIVSSTQGSKKKHKSHSSPKEATLNPSQSNSSLQPGSKQNRLSPSESASSLRHSTSMHDVSKETIEESIAESQPAEVKGPIDDRRAKSTTPAQASSSSSASLVTPNPRPNLESFNPANINHSIPSRQSSLRHSFHGSPSKPKSSRHTRYHSSSSRDVKVDDQLTEDLTEFDLEDDPVARRIQELKAKMQKSPDNVISENRRQSRSRSRSSYPGPSSIELRERSRDNMSKRSARSSANVDDLASMYKPAAALLADIGDTAPSPTVSSTNRKRNSTSLYAPNVSTRTSSKLASPSTTEMRNRGRQSGVTLRASATEDEMRDARKSNNRLSTPGRASLGLDDRESITDSIDDDVETYLNSPRLTQKVLHPQTGRHIAFSEVGDPDGFAVVCCVGMGLTRYLTAFYDELAATLKLRLITLDRPGVGESEPCLDGSGTPLTWPDDVAIVCNHLRITKFSILAHSAGAIYAMATALRMPQHIRGRLHLMAPWIPPSQMSSFGPHPEPVPSGSMPYSQKILRALPTSFLRAANASFMSANSASITNRLPKSPRRKRRSAAGVSGDIPTSNGNLARHDADAVQPLASSMAGVSQDDRRNKGLNMTSGETPLSKDDQRDEEERRRNYNERLTYGIWEAATANANPAVDLVTCLERRQAIGFRYVDIVRAVVIHHGSKDTRVPVENVKWLGRLMKRCEVRVLDGEGHGLMASASVMGAILTEVAKEWEDWSIITQGKREIRSRKDAYRA